MARLLAIEWDGSEARMAVASSRGEAMVVEHAFTVALKETAGEAAPAESPVGEALAAALAARRIGRLDALVGVSRSSVELRQMSLPPVPDDELPDHLSVVCEFGATGDLDIAWKLLNDHRAGIELLQLALDDRHSPWADAVTALRATLPPLDGTQAEAVARLLAEGPPGEDVGLDASTLDPRLNPHPDADASELSRSLHAEGALA